jgi:proline-specific peptidase
VLVVQPPGWGIGAGLYEQTLRPLERDCTLIYYDTRGSGRSQAPPNPDDIHVGAFVEDLEALRTQLELDSFALIGHSHGGYVALNYALKYQQYLSHLLPLDAQLGVEEPEQDLQRTLPELAKDPRFADAVKAFADPSPLEAESDVSVLLERILPLYFHDPEAKCVAALRDNLRMTRIALTTMQATDSSNGRFLVRDTLSTIRVPTLILVGRHDFICSPLQAQIIHDGISGSRLAVFEESGHFPWLEEPDLFFSTVANFVRGRSSLGAQDE